MSWRARGKLTARNIMICVKIVKVRRKWREIYTSGPASMISDGGSLTLTIILITERKMVL